MKIGMQELLLVFIVALIVLGPDKLPLYARKFGEALREFRKFSSEATKDIRESIVEPLEEAQRPLREALEPITELEKEVRGDVEGIQKSFSDIGKPTKKETGSPEEAQEEKDGSQKPEEAAHLQDASGDPKGDALENSSPEPETDDSDKETIMTLEPKDNLADIQEPGKEDVPDGIPMEQQAALDV